MLTLYFVDFLVRLGLRVGEDVSCYAQLVMVHDRHVVRLKVITWYLVHDMLLQLLQLALAHVPCISDIERNLQRIEPLFNIRVHVVRRLVVFCMLDCVVVSHFSPVVDGYLVVWEVHVVCWVDF